ncbi:MAG TPA: C40 family peptidase [Bacteroidales bacterium]|nr:C40 family peptidase [Bacteroidales bacterium]
MEFGICLHSVIPVRQEPSHKAEMITQVLFGELFRLLFYEKDWARVRLAYDNYEGWVHRKQVSLLQEREYLRLLDLEPAVTMDLVQLLSNETRHTVIPVILGSSLPGFDGRKFLIEDTVFTFDGQVADISLFEKSLSRHDRQRAKQVLMDDAMLYLNAPYLWGGRSPFGLDCSGFTQMVYKLKKIRLLRDSSQQSAHGEQVSFITEAEPGDLAFFDDEEGNITHVGLMVDKYRIIHVSGRVRIDAIDHQGIFNEEEKRYTHKLRIIKRIL